jgi:hypothetical protein
MLIDIKESFYDAGTVFVLVLSAYDENNCHMVEGKMFDKQAIVRAGKEHGRNYLAYMMNSARLEFYEYLSKHRTGKDANLDADLAVSKLFD